VIKRYVPLPDPSSPPSIARRTLGVVPVDAYRDWDEIYLDNVTRVYRTLYAKVGNRADTEDLTTEVFLAAYRPLRIESSRGEVRAYLLATCRTVLASFWRNRLRVEVTAIDERNDLEAFNAPGEDPLKADRVKRLLAGLPDRQRQVLQLRFLQAHTTRETASTMGITVANVKVLQHRALRLAAQLAKEQS
jgi:RNA polymerase sigma factor (sigma-70 family)